jgi:hypothetical protein
VKADKSLRSLFCSRGGRVGTHGYLSLANTKPSGRRRVDVKIPNIRGVDRRAARASRVATPETLG